MIKKIEGLEEALAFERRVRRTFINEAERLYHQRIVSAATAYAKIQSGECVVVPREVPVERYAGGGGGAANCTLCRAGITHGLDECAGVKFVEITPEMKERARKIQAGEVKE